MSITKSSSVKIIELKGKAVLSAGQKKFNRLIHKINQKRKHLQEWHAMIPRYREKYLSEIEPFIKIHISHKITMLKLLDQAYSQYTFSKIHKRKLAGIIQSLATDLINDTGLKEFKEIYNKYSKSNYDQDLDAEHEQIKALMSELFGVELDDDLDMDSVEDVFSNIDEKKKNKIEQEDLFQTDFFQDNAQQKHKKSASTLAKEAKQMEGAEHASKSIREIFRKLARALHPDREQDPIEQERKNSLMQRVNIAYEKNDLLALLELQLEAEQINQADINSIAEDRLKHYSKVLEEQLAELEEEIYFITGPFRMHSTLGPRANFSPCSIMSALSHQCVSIQNAIIEIKNDLAYFQNVKNIKCWLNRN